SNTYNPGWRNHPNFSWSNQNTQGSTFPPGFPKVQQQHLPAPPQQPPPMQPPLPTPEKKPSLEELVTQFVQSSEARHRNQEASIHNLEKQIGQLAKMIAERPLGSLPSNTEPNPREQVNAITLRSGKELQASIPKEKENDQQSGSGGVEFEQPESAKNPQQLILKEYKPRIPYPARLVQSSDKEQFSKFLELL